MTLMLLGAGAISLIGAVIHSVSTPLFGWAKDLNNLTDDNRRSALSMNIMVTYVLIAIAVADYSLAFDLMSESTAALLLIVIAGFWGTRMIVQLMYYTLKKAMNWLFLSAYVFMTATHVLAI